MLVSLIVLLAENEGSGSGDSGGLGSLLGNPLLLLPILLLVFWLLVARPAQKRQERDRLSLINNMQKNDKVITNAGIIGTVHSLHDDEVVLKLEDSAKMRVLKSVIVRNATQEEALAQQKAAAASSPAASTAVQPKA